MQGPRWRCWDGQKVGRLSLTRRGLGVRGTATATGGQWQSRPGLCTAGEGRSGGRLSARSGGWLHVRVWSDKNNLSRSCIQSRLSCFKLRLPGWEAERMRTRGDPIPCSGCRAGVGTLLDLACLDAGTTPPSRSRPHLPTSGPVLFCSVLSLPNSNHNIDQTAHWFPSTRTITYGILQHLVIYLP